MQKPCLAHQSAFCCFFFKCDATCLLHLPPSILKWTPLGVALSLSVLLLRIRLCVHFLPEFRSNSPLRQYYGYVPRITSCSGGGPFGSCGVPPNLGHRFLRRNWVALPRRAHGKRARASTTPGFAGSVCAPTRCTVHMHALLLLRRCLTFRNAVDITSPAIVALRVEDGMSYVERSAALLARPEPLRPRPVWRQAHTQSACLHLDRPCSG